MLAKDPAQRYPTPGHAAEALQGFFEHGRKPEPPVLANTLLPGYLHWVESHSGVDSLPVSIAPALQSPAVGARAPEPVAARVPSAPAAIPVAPPALGPVTQPAPVKVVPALPGAAGKGAPIVRKLPHLSRRDCIMLGLGAGGLLCAEGIGWFVAWLVGRKK